ncbi:MAG: low molecular weight protein arginine phosphatase, partial [Veillonella sp.]|nr:low molecular weight protein arginine phosphatase [Veillonella sp.]
FPEAADKIKTLAEWGGQSGDVADPYGGSQEVYNQCAEQMYNLINAGLDSLEV